MLKVFYIALFVVLTASCITQRKCLEKFPPPEPDTTIVETVVYRDTTIFVTLAADTVRDSIEIFVDRPAPEIPMTTVTAENKFAQAVARIENNHLKVDLYLNERRLEITIDSLAAIRTKTITVTKTIIQKEKFVPVFYKANLVFSILLILFIAFAIYVSRRR